MSSSTPTPGFYPRIIELRMMNQIDSLQITLDKRADLGPDHVQVFWKHKSIGNISQLETSPLIGWLARSTNQRPKALFPIDLCFQLNYASKILVHDPATNMTIHVLTFKRIMSQFGRLVHKKDKFSKKQLISKHKYYDWLFLLHFPSYWKIQILLTINFLGKMLSNC